MRYSVYDKSRKEIIEFPTKEERDAYVADKSIYQGELPGVEVTAKKSLTQTPQFQDVFGKGNPIWGQDRTQNYSRVEKLYPNISSKYDILSNLMEGTNVMSGGVFNLLSPAQQIGAVNSDNYWMSILGGNSGIPFFKNPTYNSIANSAFDILAYNPLKAFTAFKLANGKYYSGVKPFNARRFRQGKYSGDIWTSNKPSTGYSYAMFNNRTNYPVSIDESKLKILEIPDLKNSHYTNLPLKLTEKGFKVDFNLPSKSRVTTDQVVKWSKEHGYDATRIRNIIDPKSHTDDFIIHSGTPREIGEHITVGNLFRPLDILNSYNNINPNSK